MKIGLSIYYALAFLSLTFVHAKSIAQIQVNSVQVDSLVVSIQNKPINLKKLETGNYRAWIKTEAGLSTFTFNPNTQQITSRLEKLERKPYSDEYEVVSYINCDSAENVSRTEFALTCNGIFHGEYAIKNKENGSFWRDALHGTVSLPKTRGNLSADTVTYHNGQKQGLEVCEASGRIVKNTFYRGELWQKRMFNSKGALLSVISFKPKYIWMEFYPTGDAKRIFVTDSVHMYFENQKIAYSKTINKDKNIWEEKAYHPNGKLKRYQTHKSFRHSPISETVFYDENGKTLSVHPDAEAEVDFNYSCSVSSTFKETYAKSVAQQSILSLEADSSLVPILQNILTLNQKPKIKKKYVGEYNFVMEWSTDDIIKPLFFTQFTDDNIIPNAIRDLVNEQTMDISLLSNYPITYLKLQVNTDLIRP